MSKVRFRHRLEYAAAVPCYWLIRHVPHGVIRVLASAVAAGAHALPGLRGLVRKIIRAAMIGNNSFFIVYFKFLNGKF